MPMRSRRTTPHVSALHRRRLAGWHESTKKPPKADTPPENPGEVDYALHLRVLGRLAHVVLVLKVILVASVVAFPFALIFMLGGEDREQLPQARLLSPIACPGAVCGWA